MLIVIIQWLYTQDVMPTLLSFLGPEHGWATQTSAADFIKAIITVSANASQNEQTCIGPNELTRQLVSKPCVEQLIKYMLGGGNPLTCGVGIVIEVIRKNNSDYDPEATEPNSTPSTRDPIYLGTLLRMFADHIPDFANLIMNAPAQKERFTSTFGDHIEPLGFDRFKTCELMAELLHCSNMGLLNEVGAEEVIAQRDAQRQVLRTQGRLVPVREQEPPSAAEDITMRSSHSSPADTGRKLGVTNTSADDDGFEEVTHTTDEDITHGIEELPEVTLPGPTSSFLDKDEDDFVDEPLSSPRLRVRDLHNPMEDTAPIKFDDPNLVVAPLSPTKTAFVPIRTASGSEGQSDAGDKTEETSTSKEGSDSDPKASEDVQLELGGGLDKPVAPEEMSPHPDDTPAPLFSTSAQTTDASEPKQVTEKEEHAETSQVSTGEQSGPDATITHDASQADKKHELVVGDYLKMQFVEYKIVPTILSFFFSYPWNNFLHNVVYDIVQQVFNGPMKDSYNHKLAISLFETADITNQIIGGQLASEKSENERKTRMGYMGHLTLIAEEVVKFTERHETEVLTECILEKVMARDWIEYVEGPLSATRTRDNAVLGGVRPESLMGRSGSGMSGVGLSALGSLGLSGGSNALAEAGLNGGQDVADSSGGNGIGPFAISAGTLMSGFGSSSDEDEDEEQDNEEDVNNEVGYSDYVPSLLHPHDMFPLGSSEPLIPSKRDHGSFVAGEELAEVHHVKDVDFEVDVEHNETFNETFNEPFDEQNHEDDPSSYGLDLENFEEGFADFDGCSPAAAWKTETFAQRPTTQTNPTPPARSPEALSPVMPQPYTQESSIEPAWGVDEIDAPLYDDFEGQWTRPEPSPTDALELNHFLCQINRMIHFPPPRTKDADRI